ncbi:MAG: arabinose efflux permease, partial [Candidatus Kerfeldbacteria bacterium CG08_land_8_20_14_0_20_42_7]
MDESLGQTNAFAEVLRIRGFRYLWFGQIVSQIAINMMTFVLALRIYETTGSNTAVSFMYLAVAIPAVLFGPIAGVYVDRIDKKVILTLCNISRAVIVLGFFFSSETYVLIFVLAVFISFITQFFVPAEAPTIPRLVPSTLLLTANSLFTFTFYTSVIIGFILSGPALR